MYLAGSYADERGEGRLVCDTALQKLHKCHLMMDLRLFCCGAHNTAPSGAPLATSLAYDTSSGQITQGEV